MNVKTKVVDNINSFVTFVCIFGLLLAILFSLYPLLMLPIIAVISPFANKSIRLFLSIISVSFFIMFYSSIIPFSDIAEYITVYRGINETDILGFGRFGGGIEICILFLMRIVYLFSNGNEYAFLLIYFSLIQLLLFTFCLRVNSRLACLYFITFNLSYSFYSFNVYFLRSMLAAVILLNAFLYVNKKRYLLYFLAITSHASSVLFIGLWEYLKDRNKKIKFAAGTILLSLVAFCIIFLRDRIEYYLFKSSGNSMGYVQAMTFFVNFLLCFIILWYSNIKTEVEVRKVFFLLIVFLFLAAITYNVPQSFGIRISLFLYALSPFFIYPLLRSEKVTLNNKILSLYTILSINTFLLFTVLFKGDEISFYMFNSPFDENLLDIFNRCLSSFAKGYYSVIYSREF
ncbi:hypothetical protein M2371_000461 [Buttiauxella sp. BIGb0471]|uniref:EpsG family protein n=1 Tax=Buttiauxella sp. BIGb0471 TaxID=2940597 RepID=UPI002167A8D0|nr:EpsG family protein [Buttiauxella sp. BIGb0471]MCS3601275.1 hypothetical protein [Buttiauxella sp. BIGb0471]